VDGAAQDRRQAADDKSMRGSRSNVAAWAVTVGLLAAVLAILIAAPPAAEAAHHGAKACQAVAKAERHAKRREAQARTATARRRALADRRRLAARRARCAAAARGGLIGRRLPVTAVSFGDPFTVLDPPTPATPAPAAATATPTPTPTPTPDPNAPPDLGTGRAVQVQGSEFALMLSRLAVYAGSVRVEYNTYPAEDPHSLVLVRADGSGPTFRFPEQAARTVVDKDLTLSRGTWLLFCNIADHEAKGMKTELTVR
jgi:hypothetical protein